MVKRSVVPDSIERIRDYPWDEVEEPPAGSGTMTDRNGRPLTQAEVDEWVEARLEARRRRT